MDWAMLSKFLIPFSVDGWSCVPSLLFDLRPNYGGGNEDNGNLLQKVHAMPHSVPSTPQQTDPDFSVSVQASLAEARVGGGLLQGRGH